MKSLKILIPAFVIFLSSCGTSQMMQSSSSSGDDVYYSSSASDAQPSSANTNNEVVQTTVPAQQPVESPQYSTDADNGQIVTSSGDNTQDLNRSSQNYPQTTTQDSSGNTYVTNNYYGSGSSNSPYGSRYGYNNYDNYGSNYGYGGGYNSFGFNPGFSLSLGFGFGSPFYSGFSSFYNPFYSPFYYPDYYSPYGYGLGYGFGGYNPYSYYNSYSGYDYNYGNGVTYAQNFTGIRKSSGNNSSVHVARTPVQINENNVVNKGTVIRPRVSNNGIRIMNNSGSSMNGNIQNQAGQNSNRPSIQIQNNNQQPATAPQQGIIQQMRPAAPSNSAIPHRSAEIKSTKKDRTFMDQVARQNNFGNRQTRQVNNDNSNKSFNWGSSRSSASGGNGDRHPHF